MLAIGIGRARRTQFNWVITGVAAVVNVVLNLTLIPVYGMMGAAIATVAAYTVMFVGMAWWAQRVFRVPYQWRRVATAAAAGVALAVVGKLVGGGLAARRRPDRRLPARAPAARLLPAGRAEAPAGARRPHLSGVRGLGRGVEPGGANAGERELLVDLAGEPADADRTDAPRPR